MSDLVLDGFVVRDDSSFLTLPSVVILEGTIVCLDGISLDVQKQITILEGTGHTAWVKTTQFTYQAWIRGGASIFRYCSPHGHRPYVHKHVFAPFDSGRETEIVEITDEDRIPTMREVIEELREWHGHHAARIRDELR